MYVVPKSDRHTLGKLSSQNLKHEHYFNYHQTPETVYCGDCESKYCMATLIVNTPAIS